MNAVTKPIAVDTVVYPESDGKPMAENTLQYQWIVHLRENIAAVFADRADVLVAADNLIYPVRGDAKICIAPDVYIAIGRPAGHRGSYRVWDEGGLFPQVVMEVLSPGNRQREMQNKLRFYRVHGAEEYYVYDPDDDVLEVRVREGRRLVVVEETNGWVSPRLGIRFDTSVSPMVVYYPNGERFLSFLEMRELHQETAKERDRATRERDRATRERDRANQDATLATRRAEALAAKLRELGIDPDKL